MKTHKTIFTLLLALLFCGSLIFTACPDNPEENKEEEDTFVPVENITGITLTTPMGFTLSLSGGTVVPGNADKKTITWTLESAGTTRATLNGTNFLAPAEGQAVIKGTVKDGLGEGQDYSRTFTITVGKFVAVSSISLEEDTGVRTGFDLKADVLPEDASYQTIIWSVITDEDNAPTPSFSGNKLTAGGAGDVRVQAKITNGKGQNDDFTAEFYITLENTYQKVTSITPPKIVFTEYMDFSIETIVTPTNATNTRIKWEVLGSGTDAVDTDGNPPAFATGGSILKLMKKADAAPHTQKLHIQATITNGQAEDKDFIYEFYVDAVDYVPVDYIIVKPWADDSSPTPIASPSPVGSVGKASSVWGYAPFDNIDLSKALAYPSSDDKKSDATFSNIVWSIETPLGGGGSGTVVSGNGKLDLSNEKSKIVAPYNPGVLKLRATIKNGGGPKDPGPNFKGEFLDYYQIFSIYVTLPVTGVSSPYYTTPVWENVTSAKTKVPKDDIELIGTITTNATYSEGIIWKLCDKDGRLSSTQKIQFVWDEVNEDWNNTVNDFKDNSFPAGTDTTVTYYARAFIPNGLGTDQTPDTTNYSLSLPALISTGEHATDYTKLKEEAAKVHWYVSDAIPFKF